MTASNSKANVGGDKNASKSTAETRRASKPLMEKRRRARINQSLAILKSLIVDSQKIEGQKHSKLEKADILEMTVSHLQSVKKSDEQKFMEGFEECLAETLRFLEKSKINSSVVDKLGDHLKTFQSNVDPSSIKQPILAPESVSSTTSSSAASGSEEDSKRLQGPTGDTQGIGGGDTPSKCHLNIPRFKVEPSASISSPSIACLSPSLSISNDSNNNNYSSYVDGYNSASPREYTVKMETQRILPTMLMSPSLHISRTQSPASQYLVGGGNDNFVLNLSTTVSPKYELHHNPHNPHSLAIQEQDYPMGGCDEPLDFSKPLDLCKHPEGYRLSEDGVWRPW